MGGVGFRIRNIRLDFGTDPDLDWRIQDQFCQNVVGACTFMKFLGEIGLKIINGFDGSLNSYECFLACLRVNKITVLKKLWMTRNNRFNFGIDPDSGYKIIIFF